MRRAWATALAVGSLVLGLGACTSDDPLDASPGPIASPTGWRWEAFGDIEVSVPGDWAHGTGDVASALWCISDAGVGPPIVVRPGVEVEATCPGGASGEPDPASLVATGGTFVSFVFAASEPGVQFGTEGDRTTRRVGSVVLRVQAPQNQREAILATVRQITVDAHGCPTTDPISTLPTRRPDTTGTNAGLDEVRSVSACRYAIPGGKFSAPSDPDADSGAPDSGAADGVGADATEGSATAGPEDSTGGAAPTSSAEPSFAPTAQPSADPSSEPSEPTPDDPAVIDGDEEPAALPTVAPLLPAGVPAGFPTLLSSVELDGDEAKAALRGIAESPRGIGPDADNGCADPFVRGTEAIVLRVSFASGSGEIYLHYGGCRNGFDDGVAERMLSRGAVAPFVSGANSVPAFGDELGRILDDPNAPATSGDPTDSDESPPPDGEETQE